MDKTLRNAIIAGILIVSISIAYFLIFKPEPKQQTEFDACYEKCTSLGVNQDDCLKRYCGNFAD
jgi:hypothetical protein